MRIKLIIPGSPVAKPRAKGWFNKATNQLHHYYKASSGIKEFEQHVRDKAFEQIHIPFDGPIEIHVIFVFPRTKGIIWKKKEMLREPKITKPDYDNLLKSCTDALNGIAFRDDGQVWAGSFEKWTADGTEQPRTEIIIDTVQVVGKLDDVESNSSAETKTKVKTIPYRERR